MAIRYLQFRSTGALRRADGRDVDYSVPFTGGPLEVGFDRCFGISASLNMSPFCYLVDDRPLIRPTIHSPKIKSEFISVDQGIRSPDFTIAGVMPTLTGQAIAHIDDAVAAKPNKPFFLYFPLTAPHLPVIPNEEFRGTSEAGMYGDFVREVDATVGAITETLEHHGLTENTLVIFTSDNGGLYHWWTPRESDDVKHYKIGIRGQHVKDFGHQGNAHLRGTKADIWEGGHRVPFITTWPKRIAGGSTSDALIELTDLLATSAAIVGEELSAAEKADSYNFLPVFTRPATRIAGSGVRHSSFTMGNVRDPRRRVEVDSAARFRWLHTASRNSAESG